MNNKNDDFDINQINIPKIKINKDDDKKTIILKKCLNFSIVSVVIVTLLIANGIIKLNRYLGLIYFVLFFGIFIFIPFNKKRIKTIVLSIIFTLFLFLLVGFVMYFYKI